MQTFLTPEKIQEMNLEQLSFSEYRFAKGNLKDGETFYHDLGNGCFEMVEFVEFTDESGVLGRWNSLVSQGRSYSILTGLAPENLCIFGRKH